MQDSPAGQPPAPDESDWRRLAETSLAGRPLASIDAAIEPGLSVDALAAAGALPPLWSRAGRPWWRLQRLEGSDSQAVQDALAAGADGFEIAVAGTHLAHGSGLPADALDDVLRLMPLERCRLRFAAGGAGPAVADAVERAVRRDRLDADRLAIAFGLDPLGVSAGGGPGAAADGVAATVRRLVDHGFSGPFLTADARLVASAGGGPTSELAYALAALLTYLRALLDAGLADGVAVAAIDAAFATDQDQFVAIAKLRAFRLMHARLLAAAGLPPVRLSIHAETSWRMLAAEDARSNLVRATIGALAAGLGGADSLSVLPFSAAEDLPDPEAGRLALTTQAILVEESHLARVADPGAGSGTIEALTLALAEAGWAAFQRIEREGGLPAAIASGSLQAGIAAEAARRAGEIASGARPIIGVTLFRADGAPAATPPDRPVAAGAALRPRRDASAFERLRS